MRYCSTLLIFFVLSLPIDCLFGNTLNNEADSIQAARLYRVAREYADAGQYYEALDSFLVSLELRKRFYGEKNNILAGTYMAVGTNYKNIGKYDLALKYTLIAENLYINRYGKNSSRLVNLYLTLGNIYRAKLNYPEALQYFEHSINILKKQGDIDYMDIAYNYYSVAEVYFLMQEYDKAIEIINNNIGYSSSLDKIYYYELLGAIYNIEGRYDLASEAYRKSIKFTLKLYPPNNINIAIQYLNYASFKYNIGDYEETEVFLEKAYSIISLTETEKGTNLADYYRIYGFLSLKEKINTTNVNNFRKQKYKNYQKAILYYKKALKAYNFPTESESFTDLDEINSISVISSIDLLKWIADTYNEIAVLFEGYENGLHKESILKSLDYYEVVSKLIQKTKKELSDDNSRILLSGLEQSTFIKIIQSSYRAYKLDSSSEHLARAFQNAELLKSGSLFDKLSNDAAMKSSFIPDSLLGQEQKINSGITSYEQKRYNLTSGGATDTIEIERIDSILFNLKRQRTGLNDFLESNYSRYYHLKYSDNSMKISEIQKELSPKEVLFEYVLNEQDSITELYTFFFSKNEVGFNRQEFNKSFTEDIDEIFRFMSTPDYLFTKNEDSKRYCTVSNRLFLRLMGAYENKIKDKKILIIPDGKLNYIPFDALLSELPDTTSTIHFNKLNYLIKSNCINYSYSANLLYNVDKTKKSHEKEILAFAPEYSSDSITIGNGTFPLRPLWGTQKEVDIIASEIKTKVYKGAEATELNFREKSGNYDILHLAMHAFVNDSLPSLSQFAFAQNKNGETDNDGLLSAADIYNLNLNARLSVLSACNTGTGQLKKGEGVISLARGFLYAGCPAIIMTLWEVEDNSGTKIMGAFYKFLKRGKRKDEALRLAKMEYMEGANSRLAHPHYWLGYVSIGDNSPLYLSYDFYFFTFLLLAVLGIIAEQVIRIKKARKNGL